ncbi:MAG: DeoR/GlpR family DNA-binding transcription regulator [Planctomycetota bacterium]|jgi:DeoR/GlpR family transcriptional regulator of sugar metabolism|nr:DeoR/GlpR family DNA-binding transcription regulator [Planctomycetota bacterium]
MTKHRLAKIQSLILDNSYLNLSDLSRRLGVSESTVRRDLQILEKRGVLTRNHGGAVVNEAFKLRAPGVAALESPISIANRKEKEAVGREAAKLVKEGDFIAIGSGTTCLQFARCLRDRENLKIFTNNVLVALELSCRPAIQVVLAGGVSIFQNNCVNTLEIEEGAFGIGKFLPSAIFCSVLGIDFSMGYSDINFNFLRTWKSMLQRAERSVLLTTAEKFDKRGFATIGDLDCVDEVVTTSRIPEPYLAYYRKHGIAVHIADYEPDAGSTVSESVEKL